MKLFKVNDPAPFDGTPEYAMGVHLGLRSTADGSDEACVVLGGMVAVVPDDAPLKLADLPWSESADGLASQVTAFETWLDGLDAADVVPSAAGAAGGTGAVTPTGPLPPPPPRPSSIYGHLPFTFTTGVDTVIYRFEAFPKSRRVTEKGGVWTIAADTYAAPFSEAPFVPTGFAAVARYALPSLFPARFRLELRPPPKTPLECGASVPLYGQSGGGVEVRFPAAVKNQGTVAFPVVLPAL